MSSVIEKKGGWKERKGDHEKKKATAVKATKPCVNVSRDTKATTQSKRVWDKKEKCAVSGGSGPDVRKKSDARSSVVGPGKDESKLNDNNWPNKSNGLILKSL